MKTIMSRTPHDSSFSFSRRNFHRIIARVESAAGAKRNPESGAGAGARSGAGAGACSGAGAGAGADEKEFLVPSEAKSSPAPPPPPSFPSPPPPPSSPAPPRGAMARIRSTLISAIAGRRTAVGSRITGTLFGPRRGHVRLAFQVDPRSGPVLLVELAMTTTSLIREMASGLVRIALECAASIGSGRVRLVEERLWRAYCNGKKCGYAVRRECGAGDWRVLRALEPVTMGAGVLPATATATATEKGGGGGGGGQAEVMYMRARFERVVGSRDSEAFYMMNPDGNGGPDLSIYLLRV